MYLNGMGFSEARLYSGSEAVLPDNTDYYYTGTDQYTNEAQKLIRQDVSTSGGPAYTPPSTPTIYINTHTPVPIVPWEKGTIFGLKPEYAAIGLGLLALVVMLIQRAGGKHG